MIMRRRLSVWVIGIGCVIVAGTVATIRPLCAAWAQDRTEPGFVYSELAALNFKGDIAVTVRDSDKPITYPNAALAVYDGYVVVWTATGEVDLYPFSNIATKINIKAGTVPVPAEAGEN